MASAKTLDTSDKNRIISDGMKIVDEWMGGADLFDEVSAARLRSFTFQFVFRSPSMRSQRKREKMQIST